MPRPRPGSTHAVVNQGQVQQKDRQLDKQESFTPARK